jgi:hypothetical protein
MKHSGVLDARNGSVEGHLPAVFRSEGDQEKIVEGCSQQFLSLWEQLAGPWSSTPTGIIRGRRRPNLTGTHGDSLAGIIDMHKLPVT